METRVKIPDPKSTRVGRLFTDNYFVVPVYQRNYDWEKSQITDFWNDIKDVADESGSKDSHFLGQIVTFENDDGWQEIIDGQQRLATSLILIAAIKDISAEMSQKYFKSENYDDGGNIEQGYRLFDIKKQAMDIIKGEDSLKHSSLIVKENSAHDQHIEEYFYKLTHSFSEHLKNNGETTPAKKMYNAYAKFQKWITDDLKHQKTVEGRIDRLLTIFNSFIDNFYVVMIPTHSQIDAYTIFETLNTRGKNLEAADIIKNHVMANLSNSAEDTESANKAWSKIANVFNDNSHKISRFIRTYWASRYKVVTEAKLYRAINGSITSGKQAREFLTNLEKLVGIYSVLDSPRIPTSHYSFFKDKRITQRLDVLDKMNAMTYYPIVMALYYKNCDEQIILQVVNEILSVFVRRRLIMQQGTNDLESGFSNIAVNIWNGSLTSVDSIRASLDNRLLQNSNDVIQRFSSLSMSGGQRGQKRWQLMYLISEIYYCVYNDFPDNTLYLKVFEEVEYKSVHIRNDSSLGDDKDLLGNWTILETKLADELNNNEADIISLLDQSNLNANHDLSKHLRSSKWDMHAIESRQAGFAKEVIDVIW